MQEFINLFTSINEFDKFNDFKFEIVRPGEVIYKMKVLPQHLSSPKIAHGGSIAGFMDCVIGLSALSLAITNNNLTSTVEFKMNFIRPAKLGDELTGEGRVIHQGRSLLISTGEIKNQNNELVAVAQGTFNLYPKDKKEDLYDKSI